MGWIERQAAAHLEDVHALHESGSAEEGAHGGNCGGRVSGLAEHIVDVMHGVANLVDAEALFLPERALAVERVLLEEAADVGCAVHEVFVRHTRLIVRREHRAVALLIKRIHDLVGAPHEPPAVLCRPESGHRHESVPRETRQLSPTQRHLLLRITVS